RDWLNERAAESRGQRDTEQQELMAAWEAALADFREASAAMNEICDRHFAPWKEAWSQGSGVGSQDANAQPLAMNGQPTGIISTLRFGRFDFQVPTAAADEAEPQTYSLPAVLSYPQRPSL